MIRLDYLSCALTVVSTFMVGRKLWGGLVVAGINSVVVCVIGVHTGQYAFIPANLFCIATYVWSVRTWRRDRKLALQAADERTSEALTRYLPPRARNIGQVHKSRPEIFLVYSASSFALKQRHAAADVSIARSAAEAIRTN